MAIPTNNDKYTPQDHIQYIEHTTGKKVLKVVNDPARMGRMVVFTDETCCWVEGGSMFDWKNVNYEKIPESICSSCGEPAHFTGWNKRGCNVSNNRFWDKVRKIYWHRYSKSK